MLLGLLACCAFIAAVYVTGVHDASNAVAVPVRTRALGERSALYLAALFNVLGVVGAFLLLGEYSASWVSAPEGTTGLNGIVAALLVCAIWGVLTWVSRIPSSSTHALVGALAGVSWWTQTRIDSAAEGFGSLAFLPHIFGATLLPLFYLPPLIFLLSWLMVVPFYRLVVGHNPRLVNQHAREVLAVSASAISLLHGLQTGYLYLLLWALLSERIMDPAADSVPHPRRDATGHHHHCPQPGCRYADRWPPHRLHLRLQDGAPGPVPWARSLRARPRWCRCSATSCCRCRSPHRTWRLHRRSARE